MDGLKHGQPINIPAIASFTESVAGSHSTLESGKDRTYLPVERRSRIESTQRSGQ
ncbi:MAG: hypothetical protein R3B95_09800 [Nitrospirales bacterium]|nr:hypothetical protein [Nitrospirales bacterium]